MSIPIGIDLGTTNTVVAAVMDGRAVTLEDTDRTRLIPSIVSFHPSGSVLVGNAARDRRLIDSANTIFSVKRLIGRQWKSPEVQQAVGRFPFDLREGPKETTMVVARGEQYALPEISAFVLRRAKQIAEAHLGESVDRAVITVPANFNDLQRAATKVAGKLAGLDVLRILNEPTAAALAYGQSIAASERIAIFDLGGGTFDITLLDLSGSVFEVLATAGDTALGGDDIDILIADRMADQFVQIHRYDPRTSPDAFSKLRIMSETLKIQLSTQPEASVELKEIGYGEGGTALSIRFRMTRAELEHLARDLIDRTTEVTRFAIETIGQRKEAFDRVILVGGATRMPLVARMVESYFGKPPYLKVNPDEVVALGAAIQAYSLDRTTKKKPSVGPGTSTRKMDAPQAPPASSQRAPGAPPSGPGMPSFDHAIVGGPPGGQSEQAHQRRAKTSPGMAAQAQPPHQAPHAPPAPPPPAAVQARVHTSPGAAVPPVIIDHHEHEDTIDTFVNLPRGEDKKNLGRTQPMGGAPPPAPPPVPMARPATPGVGTATAKGFAAPSLSFELPDLSPPPPAAPPPAPAAKPPVLEFLPQAERSISFAVPASIPPLMTPPSQPAPPPPAQDWGVALAAPMGAPSGGIETRHSPLLIDVTPLSLSVETVAGWCDILIAANSPVPCDRTRVFMTAADGQTVVHVRVAQGESRKFAENTYLGEVELSGLTPAPRGEIRVAVTFEIDADGILNVKAKDEQTGYETGAKMKLLGAQTDATDVQAMLARQARHTVS